MGDEEPCRTVKVIGSRIIAKFGRCGDRHKHRNVRFREPDLTLVKERFCHQEEKPAWPRGQGSASHQWVLRTRGRPGGRWGWWRGLPPGAAGAGLTSGGWCPPPSRLGGRGGRRPAAAGPTALAWWGGGRARPALWGAPPGSARVYGGKILRQPCDFHGRSCLRHQGHVPVQADLCAEPRRGAPGYGRGLPATRLPLASRRLALQGLAARRRRLRQAAEPAGGRPPAPFPLLLRRVSHRRVSSLPAGFAQQQLENLLQVSQSD